MLFRKLRRTMALYKAQFISMVIMIALGTGVFAGFNMEWVSIEENTGYFFEKTGFADYRVISETGFSKEELEKVLAIDGVSAAARYVSVNADIKASGDCGAALTVTTDEKVSGFMVMEGEEYDADSGDGVWLSDKLAVANGFNIGDKITFIYMDTEFEGEIKGLVKSGEHMICVRDESQLMPDYSTFGFAYISPAFYREAVGAEFYPQINILSDTDSSGINREVNRVLDKTVLILSKNETVSYSEAMGESEEGKTMGSVLPVLFLLIAVLTMVTTMHRLTAREKTQIGTLKALGFKDRRITVHYASYAFMIGIAGTVLGAGIGYGLAWFIMNPSGPMGTYLDMPEWRLYMPWFCYAVFAGIIVLLTLIGFLSVRRMLKGTAAEALRPYAPSKMKRLAIERTGLWRSFGFGTRWNMRDIMRHKARTLMSLLGTLGCMMIIVCSMGMRDTMNAFLDMYYGEAMNYASCIYAADDATPEERMALADKYSGDYSASVSVQLEESPVSLDIYSVENGLVRFPALKKGFVDIGDGGAYICSRISEEYGLKRGDKFTVSPYGSDDKYELEVAGVIRSVSESIVISPAYAEKLGIEYSVNAIYTGTLKDEIEPGPMIKSVRSRQMIMDSFDTFMEIMNLMVALLIIAGVILGTVVLYNLGVMSYTERYREMATLKVVGFKDKKIASLLVGQNLWVSFAGVIIGLPAGIGVLAYLLKALAGEYEMRLKTGPATFAVSILLTFGVSFAVSLLVAAKNRKIDMVEALKGAE